MACMRQPKSSPLSRWHEMHWLRRCTSRALLSIVAWRRHVLDHRILIGMTRIAPSVIRVEVVRVVRNGPTAASMGALVLGRITFEQLPIQISDDLERVLLGDLVPLVVILDDILFARILNIAVRLPPALFRLQSMQNRPQAPDRPTTSCSHRQHPAIPSAAFSRMFLADLLHLSCRACGSSALSLAPPSTWNRRARRTPGRW